MCSTPVGVMDRFTCRWYHSEESPRPCSTPVGVMDRFTHGGAVAGAGPGVCSTPVGVMDRFTIGNKNGPVKPPVLNACRRHGSFHSGTPSQEGAREAVLNACRRHGSFHAGQASRRRWPLLGAQRLSASWIVSRVTFPATVASPTKCSTPVGVMDRFTRVTLRSTSIVSLCAQRLSASWIVSQGGRLHVAMSPSVLNACRRHGSFHKPVRSGFADRSSAQRLSASWIVSHRR